MKNIQIKLDSFVITCLVGQGETKYIVAFLKLILWYAPYISKATKIPDFKKRLKALSMSYFLNFR